MFTKFYNRIVLHKKIISTVILSLVGSVILILCLLACWLVIVFHQFLPLLPDVPTILGFYGQRRYLILFQNNMELRPGGGFIGSFATITVNKGKFGSLQVHNTYDADGQLHQHVEPYYIGRRFIQVHLYMRDSNFDVDFVKSAQKVASLYQLETGHHADGVIAIDFSYVQSLVQLLSPIYVWQYNETVTGKNVFYLTEYHADKHSFYGSTQKQDFLRSLYDSMQVRLRAHKVTYLLGIIQNTLHAIQQKHVLFALMDTTLQAKLTPANISSALYDSRVNQPGVVNDFLGINEANIGVNKSNYFLTRKIAHTATITRDGKINEKVTLTYHNASPKEQWPTGKYIPYIRVILPHRAALRSITIDGKKQHIVPAITDFRIYEAPGFTPPDGLEVDHSEEAGKTIYGFRTRVSYHTTQVIEITYSLPQKVDMHTTKVAYNLFVFKQPGTLHDTYAFSFTYPSVYTSVSSPASYIQQGNKLSFISSLLTDKHLTITLTQ